MIVTVDDAVYKKNEEFFFNVDDTNNNRVSVISADGNAGFLYITRVDSIGSPT